MASGAARWADRLTGALLLCVSCVVVAAAAPSALHSLVGGPRVQSAGKLPRLMRRDPPPRRELMFDRDDDDGAASPHGGMPLDPDRAPDDDGSDGAAKRVGMGLARRDLKVLGEASPHGAVVGEINAGDMVMIVREAGDWALIIHSGTDGVVMGWARRSEIAVR